VRLAAFGLRIATATRLQKPTVDCRAQGVMPTSLHIARDRRGRVAPRALPGTLARALAGFLERKKPSMRALAGRAQENLGVGASCADRFA
jgi:hypothetical protein